MYLYSEGYIISVYGATHLMNTLFLEKESTETEIENIVKDSGAVYAYITNGKQYMIKK